MVHWVVVRREGLWISVQGCAIIHPLGKSFILAIISLFVPVKAGAQDWAASVVTAARTQIGVTVHYDGSYKQLRYPGGDVPLETGVCADVVVRAYRSVGVDLQVLLNRDMTKAWQSYPRLWNAKRPDPNIDHRRVPNLETYLARHANVLSVSARPEDYRPGDIVTWRVPPDLPHIGIVSDRKTGSRPLIIHNIGAGAQEEDILFAYKIVRHFRLAPPDFPDHTSAVSKR